MNKKKLKRLLIIILILMIILAGGCGYLFMGSKITDASDNVTAGADGSKSLIVYFSRMGEIPGEPDAVSSATVSSNSEISGSDTEAAAQIIQQITGADMYQIKTSRYYRKSFMGTAARAWIENTLNMRPALAAKPENLDAYDTIYVGYPIWWYVAPTIINTFLEAYDFSDKKIVLFATSGGSGFGNTVKELQSSASDAVITEGRLLNCGTKQEITEWVNSL